MGSRRRHINDSNRDNAWNEGRGRIDDGMLISSEDRALFDVISRYLKGRIDLEEVKNDPDLAVAESLAKEMITDYQSKTSRNKDTEKFIREAFEGIKQDENIDEDISEIEHEIRDNDLDEITAEWVKEWNEKGRDNATRDPKAEEARNFITRSIEGEETKSEIRITGKRKKGLSRTLIRYVSLPAAAIIGVFILLRILLPSDNPDKLFDSYYEPLKAVSPVTRNSDADQPDSYASAIEMYNAGDYQGAANGFSDAIQRDNSSIASRFFMGITQLALGNYDQAISLLSDVTVRSGSYGKETQWYLGLAYLKTGEKEKALACFEPLAQTPGFYRARAEKIVRRLK